MEKREEKTPNYFQEALSDFVHDAASGGAIRHLLDLGYTTDGIMKTLDFPTPRGRVEKAVYRYLTEKGILLENLPVPEQEFCERKVRASSASGLCAVLRGQISLDGEENSYAACAFGTIHRDREVRMAKMLACLTKREREYILGIPWPPQIVYHRLDSRMLEMAVCMAMAGQEMRCYFLRSRQVLTLRFPS